MMTPARALRRYGDHPLAQAAIAEVRGALRELVGAALAERAARQALPHPWALFHGRLSALLPRWRWIARARHAGLARRYAALAWAEDTLAGCEARCCDLAQLLDLERP